MNWLAILLRALSLIAPVVKTVQVVAADDASGATKKQMAQDAITGATGIAGTFLNPADQQAATVISGIVSTEIDNTVANLKSTNSMPVKIMTGVTSGIADAVGIASALNTPTTAAVAAGMVP